MKKIFSLLVLAVFILTSAKALAAYKEDIMEDANLAAVKRLAVALPMHYKVEEAEPTVEEFTKIIFDAGAVARCYVISYDEIAENIKKDTGVDIKVLNDLESRKVFNANVGKYSDAYLTVTTANNTNKTQFFFELSNSKDNQMMYIYSMQNGDISKDSKGYKKACEDFYKKFDAAAEKSIKEAGKKDKKKK